MRVSSNRVSSIREARSLKRKSNTPPMSPALNKRVREDSSSPLQPNGDQQSKTLLRGSGVAFQAKRNSAHAQLDQGKQREGGKITLLALNSGGGGSSSSDATMNNTSETPLAQIKDGEDTHREQMSKDEPSAGNATLSPLGKLEGKEFIDLYGREARHLVPNHTGWFDWNKIHDLERRHLPGFFNGKSRVRTPSLYMEYRNLLIKKYMENPEQLLTVEDIPSIVSGNIQAARQIFELIDHWGLVNCGTLIKKKGEELATMQEISESKGDIPRSTLNCNESQNVTSLSTLYCFDMPQHTSKEKGNSVLSKVISTPSLSEARLSELPVESQGPAVEYHCNSCTADCSNKRYHCQKQADFDLCPGCFNEGMFSVGMSAGDFILMEATVGGEKLTSGGWTDQETLLLLEALELFGDNWNEIAEHVATKTKSQCILHFIKMPIEDLFMNGSSSSPVEEVKEEEKEEKKEEIKEDEGASGNGQSSPKTVNGNNDNEGDGLVNNEFVEAINAALLSAGLLHCNEPLALSDAGNPVMSLVAFLGALVGTAGIEVPSAESTLRLISDEDPAAHLSARHSYVLGLAKENMSTVPNMEALGEISTKGVNTEADAVQIADVADLEKGSGSCSQVDKVRKAAASILAVVAVKAKLLADQEEQEIMHLAAKVAENQMRKLDVKMKQFKELEMSFNREHEQIEKAKRRLLVEQSRIVAAAHLNQTLVPGSRQPGK